MAKEQQEIQGVYFGLKKFSVFIARYYFRGDHGKLKIRNVIVTFEAIDHSCITTHIKLLEEVTKEMPEIFKAYLYNNECETQLCLRFVFDLISRMDNKYNVTWFSNDQHHGKCPIHGIGGTVKNKIFRDFRFGRVQITIIKFFALYADQVVNNIKST